MQNQEISSNTNKVDQNLHKIDETIITFFLGEIIITYMILKNIYINIYIYIIIHNTNNNIKTHAHRKHR